MYPYKNHQLSKSCPMIPTFPGLRRLLHRLLELHVGSAQLPRALPQLAGGAAGHGGAGESATAEGGLGGWWKSPGKMMETLGKTMGHIGEVKDNSWKNESELRHFFVFEMGLKASRIVLNLKWIFRNFRAEFCWSKTDLQIGRLFDGCWVLDRFRMFGQYLIMNTVDPLGMG
jgi:hypothetical protein